MVTAISTEDVRTDDQGLRFIIHPIPGRIVKIESRMPNDYNAQLESGLGPEIELVIYNGRASHDEDSRGQRVPFRVLMVPFRLLFSLLVQDGIQPQVQHDP